MTESEKPTAQERFELLHARLEHYHSSGIDSVFKMAGFLLVVSGWVLTSDNAQALLARDPFIRGAAVATVLFTAATMVVIAVRLMRESQRTFRQLQALAYMPAEYYQDIAVKPSTIAPFVIADAVLSAVLCTFILRL